MSQKTVEQLIGRLATDEEVRGRFRRAPALTLASLVGSRDALSPVELGALAAIDVEALDRFADALDPRLQKVTLPAGEER